MADVTVVLYNGQCTSGGTGPGQVTLDQAEAQPYVDAGYAAYLPGKGP